MLKFVFARRLSGRIFRSFAMALILLAVSFGFITTRYGSDLIEKSSANELRVLSVVLSQLIQDQFSNLEESLDNVSGNETLITQLAAGGPNRKWFESYLKNSLKQQPQLLDLMIYDLEGRCVGSTDPDWYKIRGRSWRFFKQGLEGFSFPSIYATEGLGRVQLVSAPIFLEEEVIGVIVAIIDLQRIYELMDRKIGLSETTDAFLLDRDLQFITAGRSGAKGLVDSHLASTALASHIRDEFWVGQYAGANGLQVLGTALKISGYSWYVVVERNYEEVLRQVTSFRQGVYALTLGLLVVFILISLGISRSITRPLLRLVDSTRKIAEGRYNDPVVMSGDIEELTFIGSELERMRRQVATSQAKLRERLSESEQLRIEGERLAAIGSLAASLAHEIRNPLNAMSLLLTRLKVISDEAIRKPIVEDLFGEVGRLDRLVSSILDYARPVHLSRKPTNLTQLLCSVRDLFQSLGEARGITLKVSHADDLVIEADSDKLKQCLVNLVKNSLDAVSNGGTVQLSCFLSEHGTAQIEVTDTGPGIEVEVQKKLFTPFFTTKEHGTGLGLSMVQKIIAAHGGHIEIKSDPAQARMGLEPQGTRVIIRIPTS
jgi:signal transduction histidine kinase